MSRWTAVNDAGAVSWLDGSWDATPSSLREAVALAMATSRPVSAVPVGPFFDPRTDTERALLCVTLNILGGSCEFAGFAPLDDVVPPVPPGAVS